MSSSSIPGTVISMENQPERDDEPPSAVAGAENGSSPQNQNSPNNAAGGGTGYPTIIDMRNIDEGEEDCEEVEPGDGVIILWWRGIFY